MQSLLPWVIGILSIVVTSLPLFHAGFFRPHDFTHAARIVEMNRSLRDGEFPVRWSQNFGFGYGMPLFNFYAPLPYYLAQIPYAFSGNAIFSIKFLYLANSTLAFIGMYLFAKKYWGDVYAGTIAATVFSFATYRALDLYVRGAIGEVMAMVILPFALYGVLLLKSKPKQGILITSVSLAAVLLSHNLSGMISILIVFLFGLMDAYCHPRTDLPAGQAGAKQSISGIQSTAPDTGFRIRLLRAFTGMTSVVLSILAAIGLSAFYVFPAFVEKGFTRVDETITVGYFDFHNHFVALRQLLFGTWGYGGSVPGLGDGISFALGYIPIGLLVVTFIGFLLTYKKIPNTKFQIPKFFILIFFLAGSLFMTTNKSLFLWDQIQLLKYIQFPWRFLAFAHVFASIVTGGSMLVAQKISRGGLILSVLVLIGAIGLNSQYFSPEKYIQDTDHYYSVNPNFIRSELSTTLNDYLPKAIADARLPDPVFETFTLQSPSTIEVGSSGSKIHVATVNCSASCNLDVNIFQFPGWEARIDGKPADLTPQAQFPIYSLSVSSGTHDISVQLTDTPIRRFGNILSLVTVGAFILFYGRKFNHRSI